MGNLSKQKRAEMLEYLNHLKEIHTDDESRIALSKIETALTEKKYGLVWEEHEEEVDKQLVHNIPVFREIKDKKIIGDNTSDFNFILEGDNLHSLKLLKKTHMGKIDVIYIDPPYNTKNKEFIYDDCMIGEDDGYRHSKWLSFMNERLRLAKDLLSDEGVIFISIDDNEQAQLKLLCDEIFDSNNSIGPFIQNKGNTKNDTVNIQKNHEYILVYRKRETIINSKVRPTLFNNLIKKRKVINNNDKYFYLSDPITTRGEGGTLKARNNLGYTVYYLESTGDFEAIKDYDIELANISDKEEEVYKSIPEKIEKGYIPIRPPKVRGQLGAWTWDMNRFNENKDDIFIKKTRNGYSVHSKKYVDSNNVVEDNGNFYYIEKKLTNSKSILEYSTSEGSRVLKEIIGQNKFDNPKNLDMIKFIINLTFNKSAIILDFFAGFRVIIVIEANSYVNTRSSRLLPKFKTQKINSWCAF